MSKIRTRIFQSWFRLSRPMTLGVRAAVENADGKVLLVRHTYTEGLYLPGGGVEHGEPVIEALARELEEEGGVQLTGTPRLVGIYSNHVVFANDHVVLYHVRTSDWTGCPVTNRGEISETLWVDPNDPPDDITPGNARRLRELYQGGPPAPFW